MTQATTSQLNEIRRHFEDGGSLTQDSALELFGCARLAARVRDLREEGYAIKTHMVRDGRGCRIAEYFVGE